MVYVHINDVYSCNVCLYELRIECFCQNIVIRSTTCE